MATALILGAGISGISAAYHINKRPNAPAAQCCTIYEKDNDWGGLCGNFTIDGFRFDRFVHFSFPKDEYISNVFSKSVEMLEHLPISSNYYHGYWLRHPAQNNLSPLPSDEKVKIISDFIKRPIRELGEIENYEDWLKCQYGNYFAENFPFEYTRKYWGVEPAELETKWVGNRMHSPDLREVLVGAFEKQDKNFYYTSLMKYPKTGGFRSILNGVRANLKIEFNKEVTKIDAKRKKVFFKDGGVDNYDSLVSSLPLPEMVKIVEDIPEEVKQAGEQLMFTSGYQVSLGFNRPDVCQYLWFYIYDEDIPPARVYSPSLKSPENAPSGCSSLQAEIFFSNRSKIPPAEEVLEKTVKKMMKMGLFSQQDILVKDIRFEKYANVIFDHDIYKNREIVRNYLLSVGINPIGRFGKWDYLWSHQAFQDGIDIARVI